MEIKPIKKPKKHFKPIPERPEIEEKPSKLKLRRRGFIILIVIFGLIPTYQISKERLEILERNLKKIYDEHRQPVCEQYALRAVSSTYYPCFQCASGKIWLNMGEIWRYGVTGMDGQSGRYPNNVFYKDEIWNLTEDYLSYHIEHQGTRGDCLAVEQVKIFTYPTLPEALARTIKLIRPPGNKQDR